MAQVKFRSASGAANPLSDTRVIRYKFSDASVARDNHTIANDAWVLDNFKKNPVFLWAHDTSAPPIGKISNINATSTGLFGDVEYATAEDYAFADSVFRLVKQGYLNATSVSWQPLDWKYSADRSRPGGIDFTKVELLEVSQVPVPALPSALVTARARGIDTQPIFAWAERALDQRSKVSLSTVQLEALRNAARPPFGLRTAFTAKQTEADRLARVKQIKSNLALIDAQLARHEIEQQQLRARKKEMSTLEGRISIVQRLRREFPL